MNIVHEMDKKYSGKGSVPCPHEGERASLEQTKVVRTEHGNLCVHGSGAFLICGLCGYRQPTNSI